MQHNITAPADVINFIEKYLDYKHLYTSTMYKLKNTALLNAKMLIDAIGVLHREYIIHDDNIIRFFEIESTSIESLIITFRPSIFNTKDAHFTSVGFTSQGSIFYGNVELSISKNIILNQTFFNPDSTVTINGRTLTKEELKCISGNIFDSCSAEISIEVITNPSDDINQIDDHLSTSDLRQSVTDGYKDGLEHIKIWSYNKAAYVPELQKCVSPAQPKVFEIDALNVGTQKFLCDESFTIPLHEDL